jgi:hypothetical protein
VPLHHPDLPFVLLTSQKAGSTSVAKWFFLKAGLLEEAQAHSAWIHDYEQEVFTRRPGYLRAVRRAIDAGIDVVKVVRDPAARAFSGYLELNEHWAVLNRLDHWTVYWRMRVIRDLFGRDGDYIEPFSFVQYMGWLSQQNQKRLNPHLAPQRTALERGLGNRLHARRIEDGLELFYALERTYDLAASEADQLATLLASSHHNDKAPVDAEGLRTALREGYRAHRPAGSRFPEVRTNTLDQDPETAALVRSVFRVDYDAYGSLYPSA